MKRNQFFSCKGIQMMLLAVLMLLPSEVYSRIDEDNGFKLETINNKVTVLGIAEGYENTTAIVIPSTYKGNPVTKIAPSAFEGNTKIIDVRFENSSDILNIESRAFADCSNLTTVMMRSRVYHIADEAFQNCTSLQNLDGYNNVGWIGKRAFENCTKLLSFTFYKSLDRLEHEAFNRSGLTSIIVDGWNSKLGEARVIVANTAYEEYILGTYWKPLNIGNYVFANTNITSVPSEVRVYGPGMFAGCTKLKSVTPGATEIPPYCFHGCTNLTKVSFDSTKKIYSYAFGECKNIGNVTIGPGITEIQEKAFDHISNLTIASGDIAAISTAAGKGSYLANHFGGVSNLTIESNITKIGSHWAFNSLIQTLSFSKYASIGEGAFAGCRNIKGELSLAGGTISKGAFSDTGYTTVDLTANTLKDGALDGINVSSLTMDNCQFGSETFLHSKLTGFVSVDNCDIPANAFAKQNITGLTIGANVKSIGEDAFMGCSSLADVDFKTGASTLTINSGAFANCPELLSMTIGENVIVKKDAFKGSFLASDYNSAYGASDLTINKLSNIESGALNGAKFRRINVLDVNPTGDALNNTMAQQINFENATKLAGTAMLEGSTVEILYAPKLQDITQDAIGDAPNFRDFGTIKNEYLSTSAFDFGCVYSADRKTLVFVAPGRNEALLTETVEKIDLRGTDVMASGDRTKRGIPIIDARAITNHKVTPINDESRYSCAKCIRVATGCRKYFTDFENLKGFYKPTLVQDYIQGDVNDDGQVSVADVMNVYDQLK